MLHPFPIQCWIHTPDELMAATERHAAVIMPVGPFRQELPLRYGHYFEAISSFLMRDNYRALQLVLPLHLHRAVSLSEIAKIDIISEKHGALYHVARLRVHLRQETCCMAINVAVTPRQQAFLDNEYELLTLLSAANSDHFLPTPYLAGETTYRANNELSCTFKLLIVEWFNDFHEFHLGKDANESQPIIKVWDGGTSGVGLNRQQTHSLYHRAAAILTACLDGQSFRQIYPWHHAAGDFIVKADTDSVDLRLITVRDYRCLLSPGPDFENPVAAILHFFLNMSLRMRLDRLDGVGELAWAAPDCLEPLLAGFLQSWERKTRANPHLPSRRDLRNVLRSFTQDEWLQLAEMVLEDGLVEAGELDFMKPLLADHAAELTAAINKDMTPCG